MRKREYSDKERLARHREAQARYRASGRTGYTAAQVDKRARAKYRARHKKESTPAGVVVELNFDEPRRREQSYGELTYGTVEGVDEPWGNGGRTERPISGATGGAGLRSEPDSGQSVHCSGAVARDTEPRVVATTEEGRVLEWIARKQAQRGGAAVHSSGQKRGGEVELVL